MTPAIASNAERVDVRPVRLRLSRARGFDLQALSIATNGLSAVKVTRPGAWGNPFTVTDLKPAGTELNNGYIAVPTVADAVACFEEMMSVEGEPGRRSYELRARLHELSGRNLACWCHLPGEGEHDCCHAAVLLRLAPSSPIASPRP